MTKAQSVPPPSGPDGPPPRRARRRGRWLVWALAALALLALLLVVALELLLANLDHPAIKRRLLALVKEQAGLALDYEGLEVSLRKGVRARVLRVLAPPRFAAESDTFARVEGLDVDAPLWRLALGERKLTALTAERIEVVVVRDASGASSLSELFPARDDAANPPAPLSRSLTNLPELELDEVALRSLAGRLVQLEGTGGRSVLSLSGLALHGKLHSGAVGLAGSDLTLGGEASLALREPARTATARLPSELRLRAITGDELAFTLRSRVAQQDLAAGWLPAGELLDVDGTARFDAGASRTTFELARAHALDGALAIAGRGELFDAPEFRVLASGKAAVQLESLPPLLEGFDVEGLTLEVDARDVSWNGTRVAGVLGARGGLRRALLRSGEADNELAAATLSAEARFEGATGQLAGALKVASLTTAAPGGVATLRELALDLDGSAREQSGAQELTLGALLGVESLRARSTSGEALALEGVKLDTQLTASASELAAGAPRQVRAALAVARASAGLPEQRLLLERATATAQLEHVLPDDKAAFGVRGDAQLSVSLPSVRVLEGSAPRAALRALELRATSPLSLERVGGTLSLASLNAAPHALRDLALDYELHEPLAWSPGRPGEPRASLRGRLARFDVGAGHGALEALELTARRPEPDRYALTLTAAATGLGAAGTPVPGRVSAALEADAALGAGTLHVGSKLQGAGDAALALELDARFEHEHERLGYEASLSAQKLEAFADFLAGVLPSTSALRLAKSRLRARASGDLLGVLHGAAGELPTLAEDPLASLRGKQSVAFELSGLDYRAGERSLVVPELALELGSEHGAGGSGKLHARVRSPSLTLEGGGSSVHLNGLDYALEGRFDRPPDQGTVHLSSTLALASATQSYLPAYPLERVRVSSRLEVERLRSILLRELELTNAAAGTDLKASGALELLPTGTPANATITGREALALQGRLEQKLAPLEALGYAARARGSVAVPFRLESGGLLAYRLLANVEAHAVSFANRERSLVVEGLNGVLPVTQEIVLLPSGPELSPGRRASPLAEPRFFDVHPFLDGDHFVTADTITIGNLQPLGPVAANVRLDRSDCLIDQLQAGFRGGQITGRVQLAYRPRDPLLRLRLNATGVRSKGGEVLDANLALSFAPASMTLDGKVQLVRASRTHVLDILDVLDPYHELVTANRVRGALALGYPKFVRFHLHDGAVDSKVELGGIAQLVRIDDIRAVPLGPILQRYVAPSLEGWLTPAPAAPAAPVDARLAPLAAPPQARAAAPRRTNSP